jgi:hypothetical protein
MSNNLMTSPPADDGWGAAAGEAAGRTIRGRILKFADWRWSAGREAAPIDSGKRLMALATVALWVRWENGRPVEHRLRELGRALPERDELGHTDENQWEDTLDGRRQDPWQNTRLVYLVDPDTAEAFTFSTSSFGGRSAVSDLGDQIMRMRTVHPDAVPLVELQAQEMPTKFGRKSKPLFKVIGWKTSAGEAPEQPIVERQIAPPTRAQEMDDEIPF